MRDNLLFSDAQARTNPTSTGTISTNVHDLEQNSGAVELITDDMIQGYLNVILTAVAFTSGGGEGITLELRMDDAAALATAKDGVSAGYVVVAAKEVPLERIVAGAKFSIPFIEPVGKRYIGAWLKATSTTYTGSITVDAWIDNELITGNETIQKVAS